MTKQQLLIYTNSLVSSPLIPTINGVGKTFTGLGLLEFAVAIYSIYRSQNRSTKQELHEQLKLV
jgi:hypothetical protein